jgi:CheY-like chemotaxis protein
MSHTTVLVVEDNELNQKLITRQLAHLGATDIAVVGNGLEALDWLALHSCDLVLADCHMPLMDGYAMTRQIRLGELRSGAPRLPVIAYSAGVTDEEKATCRAAGMDDHIPKPVPMAVLQAMLRTWLNKTD